MGKRPTADGDQSVVLIHERQARARVWRFVFDCYEKKKAGVEDTGEEAKGEKDACPEKGLRA